MLPLERGALARWAAGLAVAPLVASALAWALVRAGAPLPLAARIVAVAGLLAWLASEARLAGRDDDPAGREGQSLAWGVSIALAAVVGIVMFAKPFLQIRADGWIHGGITYEILERGIPPEDPRFAGLKLNYVWLYNEFIALLVSLREGSPFALMAVSNVAQAFATMAIAWLLGRRLWGSARAAAGSMLLMGLGFNAAVLLLWPIRLLTVLTGSVRGRAALPRALEHSDWGSAEVIHDLTPWGGHMVNFLDKLLHGTALDLAYTSMLLLLWAMAAALQGSRAALFWGAAAASGMLFFHGVVGLSVLPVTLAALGLAWLLAGRVTWLPPRARLASFAGATLAGALLAAPYTIAISRAWPEARSGLRFSYVGFDRAQWITLVGALAAGAWFARRAPATVWRERRGVPAVLVLWTLAMLGFASTVLLPLANHTKFVFEVFAGLAVLGGASFHAEIASWRRRFGPAGSGVLVMIVLGSTPIVTLQGYLSDHQGETWPQMHLPADEDSLYAWMRRATPVRSVFVDAGYRSTIMVKARRELLDGDWRGPEVAAFPLAELQRRRAVMADLYGAGDSLEHDASALAALGRPAYVLVRAADADSLPRARANLDSRTGLFAKVYDRGGFIVYHVESAPSAGAPRPGGRP
jgi:hypothetical protein